MFRMVDTVRVQKYELRETRGDPFKFIEGVMPDWLLKYGIKRARLDLGFDYDVRSNEAYRQMLRTGVDVRKLVYICRFFRALERASKGTDELAGAQGPRRRGRPGSFLFLFQLACDQLVAGRSDGRRFYAELAELSRLIYRRHTHPYPSRLAAGAYHRNLMLTYAKLAAQHAKLVSQHA